MIAWIESRTAALLDWAALSFRRQALIVTLLSALVLIPGLDAMPVTDRDEARFAQATKQMLETGDLIDIRFQDQPRWKKPVGIYWLQAALASVFGGVEAPIWAYRLPSVLGAWLAALFTLWGARVLIGQREALVAGAMMSTCLLLAAEGHIAKTDAALAATAAAALAGLAHSVLGRGGWGPWLMFWLAIAAAILLKGPIVPVIAIFAVAALWSRRDLRPNLARLRPSAGLALVAVLVAPWLIAIGVRTDGQFFVDAIFGDMGGKLVAGQEKHWGPPGLYLALVWLTFWPWAAFIPQVAGAVWRGPRMPSWRLLVAWLVPFWLLLEVVPTKLPHYVLPLYPALAMLVAVHAVAPGTGGRWGRRTAAVLVALPGLIIAAAILVLPAVATPGPGMAEHPGHVGLFLSASLSPGAVTLATAAIAATLIAAVAAWRGARLAQIAAATLAALMLYPAILAFALPAARTGFPSPVLARAIEQYRPCASGPAFSLGYHEPSLVFLTETGIRMADPKRTVAALTDDPGALVLIEERWIKIAGPLPPHVVRAAFTYFNPNRGKFATARLVTPEDPRWGACTR